MDGKDTDGKEFQGCNGKCQDDTIDKIIDKLGSPSPETSNNIWSFVAGGLVAIAAVVVVMQCSRKD